MKPTHLKHLIEQGELARGGHTLKRILKIFKTLVSQLDILETMTPLEFLSFRNFLDNSSGFQSYQFRELEFVLGMKSEKTLNRWEPGTVIRDRLQKRYDAPFIVACICFPPEYYRVQNSGRLFK